MPLGGLCLIGGNICWSLSVRWDRMDTRHRQRRFRQLLTGLVGFLTLAAGPQMGNAQVQWSRTTIPPNSLYFNVFAGESLYDDDTLLDDELTFGARIGYVFLPHLSVEGDVAFSPSSFVRDVTVATDGRRQDLPEGTDVDNWLYTGAVRFTLDLWEERQQIIPFVKVGGGALTLNLSGSETDTTTEPVFIWGGGVEFLVRSRYTLRVEYRGVLGSFDENFPTTDTFLTSEITLGVGIHFPLGR